MENNTPIIVEQSFDLQIDQVWDAITRLEKMTQWFFENIPDFKPEVDFETQFNVRTPDRNFLHLWKIVEAIPNKKIVYDWKYAEYPGQGLVTFELFDKDSKTLLRVTSEGMQSFPQDIPEFSRESCQGGWEYFINDRLKNYLEKG